MSNDLIFRHPRWDRLNLPPQGNPHAADFYHQYASISLIWKFPLRNSVARTRK
jgi:hypothetical protein